ncbi:MAG: FAD-dependent monooxygenase, partial [Rhodobacteraceae bacterium]|nr:FAD-dependent monooxygenase [Paracoccaceae bacterium]
MDTSDLIIVGSGPVAGVLVALLAPTRWQITMISPLPTPPGSRAIALNHSSRQILQSLGIWDSLAEQAGQIRHIDVSRRGQLGKTHLSAADINSAELGWVVPEEQLMVAIASNLSTLPNLTQISALPKGIEAQEDSIFLLLDTDTRVKTRLVIGADGAASPLRELAGLKFHHHDFHSVAICASVISFEPHRNRAWERFTNNGPIALLPLVDPDTYSLVWCVNAGDSDNLMNGSESNFLSQLQNQFGDKAGRFTAARDRSAYPLIQSVCQQPATDRLLLIGSAARHLHPVGGQGLNLALRDVVVLADLIKQADRQAGDPGSPALVKQYCDLRSGDWRTTDVFARRLPGLFADRGQPLCLARNLALTALELLPPLRRAFVR